MMDEGKKRKLSRLKIALLSATALLLVLLVLFLPLFPWSARSHRWLNRMMVKARIQLSQWRGHDPGLAAIRGRVNVSGAHIEAIDSASGWAAVADGEGRFTLPDVMWYPGASFDLIVTNEGRHARLKVVAPDHLAEGRTFDVGELEFEKGEPVDVNEMMGVNSISYRDYDSANAAYYRDVFDCVTEGKNSDEEKLEALNRFVATKLNYEAKGRESSSLRGTIERGSKYCGPLVLAFATVAKVGGYRVRVIDIVDNLKDVNSHQLVEVHYAEGWHLYDPTYGAIFKNKDGRVASYREIRLDTSLVREELFASLDKEARSKLFKWLPAAYGSGFHHFYYFR
ncbi:MAG: transglutaminase domain-containing protein [Acidobacteriota bacterium]